MNYYDAHNHLQDERFDGRQSDLIATCVKAGVRRMVVNGSCAADWPRVLALAREHPQVIPSFGYHPWHLGDRAADWEANLARCLDEIASGVGEIGLDRWKPGLPYENQE
ncbi:MAG TPA: TatD family hydrolase, partial [Verrucomicrobiota bacterium]|nr:TatD family hydrolase [Verrucomicrobiota bacterium]